MQIFCVITSSGWNACKPGHLARLIDKAFAQGLSAECWLVLHMQMVCAESARSSASSIYVGSNAWQPAYPFVLPSPAGASYSTIRRLVPWLQLMSPIDMNMFPGIVLPRLLVLR